MVKGIVFFDYDGTLTEENRQIYTPTSKTVEAIKEIRQNGYYACLATGRSKCYVPESDIEFDGYITTNGSYVNFNNVEIWNDTFLPEQVERFSAYLQEKGINYVIENQQACYGYNMHEATLANMVSTFRLPKENFHPIPKENIPCVNKIVLTYDSVDKLKMVQKEFENEFDIIPHRTCLSCDVSRKGISKAVGIVKLLEYLKIPRENTYAFGDGPNDMDMLKTVGTGIAMKDHAAVLDSVATYVTDSVENDGIYQGLKHFNLID